MITVDWNDLDWTKSAVCTQVDPDIFFPNKGEVNTTSVAMEVCAVCPVRDECLEFALETEKDMAPRAIFGVFGGKRVSERIKINRERRFKNSQKRRQA